MAPTTEIDIDQVLNRIREIKDAREELARQDKELSGEFADLERQAMDYHKSTGLLALANDKLSMTFDPSALRATYDPDKWVEVVKWAVATGNQHIIQRRLTDAKVIELVDSGTALPDGLNLEAFIKVSIRRK